MYLAMEYNVLFASSWVNRCNDLVLFNFNACTFALFLYLSANGMLTPNLIEGFLFGDLTVMKVPTVIYNTAFKYFCAVPMAFAL